MKKGTSDKTSPDKTSSDKASPGRSELGSSASDKINFEEALKQLEEIVNKMESGELGLEESLGLFEEGIRLARLCNKKLKAAERKIEILTKDEKGEMQAVPADDME